MATFEYTYDTLIAAIANEVEVEAANPEFVQQLPTFINSGEERCYQDLQLLSTVVTDISATLTPNARAFTLPTTNGRFVTVSQINVFTPVGTTSNRNPLVPVSRQFLDLAWPSDTPPVGTVIPTIFAMVTDQELLVGPPPDDAYGVEVVGTIRPEPLSSSNTTTWLTREVPHLFFAAVMLRVSAYQGNWSAKGNDAGQSKNWQDEYNTLLGSTMKEELLRKWAVQGLGR